MTAENIGITGHQKRRIEINYMIFKAFAKVVTTKGSESQNHGLKEGR
ncbi:MAG: hypothetical protein ABJA71_10915 [Ginsengibacter sp.]